MIKKLAICDECGREIGEVDAWGEKYYELKHEGFSMRVDMSSRAVIGISESVHLCSANCLRTHAKKIIASIASIVGDVVDRTIKNTPLECDRVPEDAWDANIQVSHGINGVDKLDTQTI